MPEPRAHRSLYVKPSLLDRLTSPDAWKVATGAHAEAEETEGGTGLRENEFRDSVLRDLEWLFNASPSLGTESPEVLRRHPRAAKSVLNFGLRHLLGQTVHDLTEVERQIETVLERFEPRLIIEEKRAQLSSGGHLIEIELEGLLLTQQATRRLRIRTDLDTLNSKLSVETNG